MVGDGAAVASRGPRDADRCLPVESSLDQPVLGGPPVARV